jgi:DNA primase
MADMERPDLVAIMREAGVLLPRNTGRPFFVLCPFHDDRKTPNMRVDPNQGVFHCFACGVGGDGISFVGLQMFGQSFNHRDGEMFRQVVARLEQSKIPKVEYKPPRRPKELTREIVNVLTLAARVYHLALMGKAGAKPRELLKGRMIDVATMRKFRLGYAAPNALAGALAGYPPSLREAAVEAGLFVRREEDGKIRELLARRIIFPDIMRNDSVQHMVGRSTDPNSKVAYKYFALSGMPRTIWGLGKASRKKPVILTESTPDAVNLMQMGFQGAAVGGTGIASHLVPKLKKYDIVVLPQNDERGREAVERWQEILPRARIMWEYEYLQGEKDLNDQVKRMGLEKTRKALIAELAKVNVHIQ